MLKMAAESAAKLTTAAVTHVVDQTRQRMKAGWGRWTAGRRVGRSAEVRYRGKKKQPRAAVIDIIIQSPRLGLRHNTLTPARTKHQGHVILKRNALHSYIVQELCESRGGRPGPSVLTSLLVSVDVKNYRTMLRHWSQLVPNMSTDI